MLFAVVFSCIFITFVVHLSEQNVATRASWKIAKKPY